VMLGRRSRALSVKRVGSVNRFFRRRRWALIEGRLIDRRHLKYILVRWDATSQRVSVDEYMVEFPGPSGEPARVTIKAMSVHLPVRPLEIGQTVPRHVNRKGTKAIFGRFERFETRAEKGRREKARLARDEARFEEKLKKP